MSFLSFILLVLCLTFGVFCQEDEQKKNTLQIKIPDGSLFKDNEGIVRFTKDLARTKRYAKGYKKGGGGGCSRCSYGSGSGHGYGYGGGGGYSGYKKGGKFG